MSTSGILQVLLQLLHRIPLQQEQVQTVCQNTAITTINLATTGATGATFAGLPAGVTGTWAGNVATISGTPTVSGTFNYTVTTTGGCPPATTTGTITVNPTEYHCSRNKPNGLYQYSNHYDINLATTGSNRRNISLVYQQELQELGQVMWLLLVVHQLYLEHSIIR
jgi:hypothetical protein